jgi:hypothetical protein
MVVDDVPGHRRLRVHVRDVRGGYHDRPVLDTARLRAARDVDIHRFG